MASTKKIKVEEYDGDPGQQRGDLHWNGYRWSMSETSDSITQGRGSKWTEQAVHQP